MTVRGFSLLEVMVSASLFLVTVSGVVTSTNMLSNMQVHARQMTRAIHLAEFTMEELLLRFNTDPDLDPLQNPHRRDFDVNGEPCAIGDGVYVATWNVSSVPGVATLKKVNVALSWSESGAQKSIDLVTYRP